jgi:hypothetical protein
MSFVQVKRLQLCPQKFFHVDKQRFAEGARHRRFRQTEVDDPWRRFAVDFRHQNVGRLQVAME